MPHTQRIAAQYKDQDVVVVASGTSDTIAKFKEWIPKNQPKYPDLQFYFDPNERGSGTFEQRASQVLYHVEGIPTQFVIGRDGKIVATIVGNGGEEDARTEGALALAGVKMDATVAAKGRAALAAAAEQAKAQARPPWPTKRTSTRSRTSWKTTASSRPANRWATSRCRTPTAMTRPLPR